MMTKKRLKIAVGLAALAMISTLVQAETDCAATVSMFAKPPKIDGKVEPGEWDGAVRTTGFQELGLGWLEPRLGATYLGFTAERLYFAVVSEIPPDGNMGSKVNRDSDVIYDEGIEIWLDPNRDARASGEGNTDYYQLIANSLGAIYDLRFDSKKGAPDMGWNGRWEFVNTVDKEKGVWTAELSLPWEDIGVKPEAVIGRSIGIMIARNYKRPWNQVSWFPHRGAYATFLEYPRIRLTRNAPSVQIESLGENVFKGELDLRARIFNPGASRQAKVKLLITSSDMPELKEEKAVDLPEKNAAIYTYKVPAGRLHEAAQHALQIKVESPDGKETFLSYRLNWKQAPGKKWDVRVGPDPEAAMGIAYYPSYQLVRVRVDPRELGKEAEAIKSARVTIAGADGTNVLSATNNVMRWDQPPGVQEFKVPDFSDGTGTVTVALDGYKAPLVRTFERKHFVWEGNRLGITSKVYPPFEPLKVAGNEVQVVLRRYQVNGLGLWDSVKSLDRELLAAPITLVADGGQALTGHGRFVTNRDDLAVYEGLAELPAVKVKTRCTTEYDGCLKVELDLLPGAAKQELKSLWLDIPIKDREAPLWHVSTTGLRINPAGTTPAGEGDIWDSTKFPDGNWYGNFKCYIWLGAEERGLCWFADNDAGWVLDVQKDKQAPCLALRREKGVLTLRVNLVQKPVTIETSRKIVFGLMATPGKPMPKGWRRVGVTEPIGFSMNSVGNATYSAKCPRNADFSIFDAMQAYRLGSAGNQDAFIKAWAARNLPPGMSAEMKKFYIGRASSACSGDYFYMYFDEFISTSLTHPEAHVFQSEWTGDELSKMPDADDLGALANREWGIGTGGIVPSYRDFACWYAAEWIRRGIGTYLDNAFPKRAYDPLTTSAYKLPDGTIQPSAGIWAHREYLKRLWVLHQQLAPAATKPLMAVHITNTHIVPYTVFSMANWDLEWFYGSTPAQSRYPSDLLRAESIGLQSGCYPLILAATEDTKTPEERKAIERTRFGAMMVHECRPSHYGDRFDDALVKRLTDFGYGAEDCAVFNYWSDNYPVKTSDEQAKSLLLKRGSELLLLLCTWNPKPATVTLALDTKALGMTPSSALDDETNEALNFNNAGKLIVPLDGYGVRFVRVK